LKQSLTFITKLKCLLRDISMLAHTTSDSLCFYLHNFDYFIFIFDADVLAPQFYCIMASESIFKLNFTAIYKQIIEDFVLIRHNYFTQFHTPQHTASVNNGNEKE
jgi:hypothetical protein